jgi:hypothetical protein
MKKTALDWLHFELMKNIIELQRDYKNANEIWEKAKEMEMEQIQDAFDIGFCEGFDFGYRDFDPTYESSEMYYDKTYGKK